MRLHARSALDVLVERVVARDADARARGAAEAKIKREAQRHESDEKTNDELKKASKRYRAERNEAKRKASDTRAVLLHTRLPSGW